MKFYNYRENILFIYFTAENEIALHNNNVFERNALLSQSLDSKMHRSKKAKQILRQKSLISINWAYYSPAINVSLCLIQHIS